MNVNSLLAFSGASLGGGLAVAVVFLKSRRTTATWLFTAGMLFLVADSVCEGIGLNERIPERIIYWQSAALIAKSCLAGVWFCFSVTYSRGNYAEFFRKWRFLIVIGSLLPVALALWYWRDLFQLVAYDEPTSGWWLSFRPAGKFLNCLLLVGAILILMNLERTFRAAVGTARWRIKFLILGIAVIFGTKIYARSQVLLFSGHDISLVGIESGALILGCILISWGYFRSGFDDLDLYPSRAVLQTSLTVFLVGGYLFVVGLLAQVAGRLGEATSFRLEAFVVLVGVVCLSIFLFSDKARQTIERFVSRNFKRPQHDFRKIWAQLTEATTEASDQLSLCNAASNLLSRIFSALSVSIWLVDEQNGTFLPGASTSGRSNESDQANPDSIAVKADAALLGRLHHSIDLDTVKEDWAEPLRSLCVSNFRKGGHRICLPLRTRDSCLGVAILADRVNGTSYSSEELNLLECIGDQIGARLLGLRLTAEFMARKELAALQQVTAFFVHDLKNAASTLSLMLANLPVHFADPAFREDAMRGIRSTVDRINQLVSRAGSLRHQRDLAPTQVDLNSIVAESIGSLNGNPDVQWVRKLEPLPRVTADKEQLQSVVNNLLLNACDATETGGRVTVTTGYRDGWASLVVADNGCGMSARFMKESLFRPFQTTKKKGLGIGMFQSKIAVEAHHGKILVTSELGVGTTVRILIPLKFGYS
jgi:putative PEP-CTERM system histidine kinase